MNFRSDINLLFRTSSDYAKFFSAMLPSRHTGFQYKYHTIHFYYEIKSCVDIDEDNASMRRKTDSLITLPERGQISMWNEKNQAIIADDCKQILDMAKCWGFSNLAQYSMVPFIARQLISNKHGGRISKSN